MRQQFQELAGIHSLAARRKGTLGRLEHAMQKADQLPRRFQFGVFEADPGTGQLLKQGRRLQLQELPFRLLTILLDRPGELVTREELRSLLWPQTTVDFDHGLNKAVNKLRGALGDSAGNPRFVETVARRGYRFLAEVAVLGAEATPGVSAGRPAAVVPGDKSLAAAFLRHPAARPGLPTRRVRGFARALVGLGLLLSAAIVTWYAYSSRHGEVAIRSLAVLPLANLSGDRSQDFLADGITEQLIADLGRVRGLRVISGQSAMKLKNDHAPLAAMARELNVDAFVEGSVSRDGETIRIDGRLVVPLGERPIWSRSYSGDLRDALSLQGSIAGAIAGQVRAVVGSDQPAPASTRRTVNAYAYEVYLKARYLWNERTGDGLRKAITTFEHAIELDPAFAEAYAGLADAYALAGDWEYGILPPEEAFAQAKAAASEALALDDSLAEAHTSLAFALDLYGWQWPAAGAEYQRAIELNPGYATAHHWYGWHLMVLGQDSAGIRELRQAESLDPLSLIIGADLADALCIAHLYDESIAQSRKTLELEPNFAVAHYELGQTLTQKGAYDEAIAEFRRAIELSGHSPAYDSGLGYAYAASGREAEARAILADLKAWEERNPAAFASIALVYVGLADHDQAMIWLSKACDARFNPSILLRPAWDPMRSDPRFQELSARIGVRA